MPQVIINQDIVIPNLPFNPIGYTISQDYTDLTLMAGTTIRYLGFLTGLRTGIMIDGAADYASVNIDGTISMTGDSVGIQSDTATSADITVGKTGFIVAKTGIEVLDGAADIRVDGKILSREDDAIRIDTSNDVSIVNTGIISGVRNQSPSNLVSVIDIDNSDEAIITNFGKITGTGMKAIDATGTIGDVEVINRGTISSDTGITILTNHGDDIVKNYGVITGIVNLGRDDDYIMNAGKLDHVVLGAGNDVFNGVAGYQDLVYGGSGNDLMIGGNQTDDFGGDSGNDTLYGNGGIDYLFGDAGHDTIYGGNGRDVIVGGHGKDQLYGGAGADQFVFTATSDSLLKSSDVIHDFERGLDRLDMRELDPDGVMDFIGSQAFTGAGEEIRIQQQKGGAIEVLIDRDGDKSADMRIIVNDVSTLTSSDFLL